MKTMKSVLAFFGSLDKGLYPVFILTALLETLESYGILLISSVVLNRLSEGSDIKSMMLLIGAMILGYGLLHLVKKIMDQYRSYCTTRFRYRYWEFVTRCALQAPYWRLENQEFIEVIDQVRQNEDIYSLSENLINKVFGIIQTGFSVLVALISFVQLFEVIGNLGEGSFTAGILILLVFLLSVSSTGYMIWRRKKNAKSIVRLTEDLVKRNKKAMYLLNEVIARYPLGKHIRLYGMQERLLEEERSQMGGYDDLLIHMYRMEMKPSLVGDISSVAISGVIYLTVSAAAMWGGLGVGSVIWYAGVVQRLLESVRGMVSQVSGLYSDCVRQQVMFKLRDLSGADGERTKGPEAAGKCGSRAEGLTHVSRAGDHVLEFEDVSFAYPDTDRLVLDHVNLRFSGTQRIALVGRNGCGKSTLIKLICRLYDPSEGRILLDGKDIRSIPQEEYRALLAVVFQDFQIFAAALKENIALGRQAEERKVQEVIGKVGLKITKSDTPLRRDLDENGVEVSGGEGQKIAIARALYKDSSIVILDEPTAALDPLSESEIYEKFNTLVDGKLALFISHRLSSCRFCDRILVLQDGGIVQDGSHETLVAQSGGLYREMWDAQSQYYSQA